jgi:hypothetical protein
MPKINSVIVNNTKKTWDLFYRMLSIPENLKLLGWMTISDKVEVFTTHMNFKDINEHYEALGYTYANSTKKDEDGYAISIHYCGDPKCDGDCGTLDCSCIDTCRCPENY